MERALPTWFDDAKLGIFVHWTAAAVPAFAPVTDDPFNLAAVHGWEHAMAHSPYVEWYQNSLSIEGSPVWEHHRKHHGDLPYDAFVEQFLAGHAGWDPTPWADLFAAAGAEYVVLVTKHHDGVLLWPSEHPNPHKPAWGSERDIVGELATAVRDRGMRFGTYYSGGLDWTFGGLPMTDFNRMLAAIPQDADYIAYADAHWRELVARYEPSVLWNDIGYPAGADLDSLFTDYYDVVPDGVVNNRFDWLRQTVGQVHCDFITPEYSTTAPADGKKWEACRGIGTSFGYNREETEDDHLSVDDVVRMFVDIVARGGNLLLNVGPTGAGVVPPIQAERLLALGWWLRTNGQAIYGTRPCVQPTGVTADGIEVRYTQREDELYAILLGTPTSDVVELAGLPPVPDAVVHLLGHTVPLTWDRTERGGIRVQLPGRPAESPAVALRICAPPA
jgi:alpha-L-fucosidase